MVVIVSIWFSVVACRIPKFGDRCMYFKVVVKFVERGRIKCTQYNYKAIFLAGIMMEN